MKFKAVFALVLVLGLSAGCGTKQVTRVDEKEQIDLSGRWNDTDSRLVADEMVQDILTRPWLNNYVENSGEKPVIVVGLVKNRTSEHIAMETFIKDLERAIVNSAKVRLVQGAEFREDLRNERADQQNNASLETLKRFGLELGADFILQGTLNSITDSDGRTKVIFYQTNLELSNLETNEKVWIGDKKIKKVIK